MVAARRGSPLIAGRTEESAFVASDIPAILPSTREIYVLDDDQVVEARPGRLLVTTLDGDEVTPARRHIPYDIEVAEKAGYADFMLKEIHEQPQAIRETLRGRTRGGRLTLDELQLSDDELRDVDKVFVVGCGTSYHAGLVAKHAIEHWARLPTEIDVASEFRYRSPVLDAQTLVIGVSQSGESLDTMEACRFARSATNKARVLAVCNVVDASMARESDAVLYTRAGLEIGVAATKTHVAQIVAMELLALRLAELRGTLFPDETGLLVESLHRLPGLVDQVSGPGRRRVRGRRPVLGRARLLLPGPRRRLPRGAGGGAQAQGDLLRPGRGLSRGGDEARTDRPHRTGDGGGGGGHPRPAAVEDHDEHRGGEGPGGDGDRRGQRGRPGRRPPPTRCWGCRQVPAGAELFSPVVDVVALQLFAYAVAKSRGWDVDQPRNLAKTVTVE